MQSRRDQIQAYSFIVGRLNSGVLRVDIDSPDQPVSRTSRGIMTGLVLGLVTAMIAAIYGFVVPGGNTSWRTAGAFVVVKDSGARFLYVGGALHPVLNEASAKLVAGNGMVVTTVDSASLRGAKRGAAFGIVGAPDALPGASSLTKDAWSACSLPSPRPGASPQVVLRVGTPAQGIGLSEDEAVLTSSAGGQRYLLWKGRRLTVGAGHGESQALGYGTTAPVSVSAAFLDSVPAGPDLVTPDIDGIGTPGPVLAGQATRVGQLFADSAGRHYLLTGQGLAPLTPTLFALFLGDPQIQDKAYGGGAVQTRAVGPIDFAQHTVSPTADPMATRGRLLPLSPPNALGVPADRAVCVNLRSHDGGIGSTVSLATVSAAAADALPSAAGTGITPSCHPADLVAVRPGSGALVAAAPAGGGTPLTAYLVGDDGVKFPIPSAGVVTQLGYSVHSAVTLPAPVLSLLATGPSLDPSVLAHPGIVQPSAATICAS